MINKVFYKLIHSSIWFVQAMFLSSGYNPTTNDTDSKPSINQLFSKSLLVSVNERGSSLSRNSKFCITVELSSHLTTLRKELIIRLTDEYDPFFIYNLNLNEEDFQLLKSQQGLLIDFPSFPQKFIDLLELCLKEEHKDSPKFLLNLKTTSVLGSENISINLDIIETNPFKHLSHLSLKLLPATDSFVRKYLALNLKSYKEEKERIENALRMSQSEYQNHLHHCQENQSSRNQEFDRIHQSLKNEIISLNRRHTDELRNEQEKALRTWKDAEITWEKQKSELQETQKRESEKLQEKIKQLESQILELQEKYCKAENHTREIRSHFVNSEDELFQLRQKNAALTKENKSLDLQLHDQLKALGTLKSQLAAASQEIKEKEQILLKTQELLKCTQDQKKQLDELLDQKQAVVIKRENALRTVSDDLNKGNEIIKKLQMEIRNYHSKIKIHSEVACKQEEAIQDKEKMVLELEKELKSYKTLSDEKDSEISSLKKDLKAINENVEKITSQNKSNENVISWLNKQLNECGISKRGLTSTMTDPIPNMLSLPIHHGGLTSTPSVPQSFPYRTRTTVNYPDGTPIFNSNPNYFRTGAAYINPEIPEIPYGRKTMEPDPISPPTATNSVNNTAVKQISSNKVSRNQPQIRSSKTTDNKMTSIPSKSK